MGDAWDLVRAWGREVVLADAIEAAAHIVDDTNVVIVNARLPAEQRQAVAWEVLSRLVVRAG